MTQEEYCTVEFLQKALPKHNITEVLDHKRLSGGILNDVYYVNTIQGVFVIKAFKPNCPDPTAVLSREQITDLVAKLNQYNVAAPNVYAYYQDKYEREFIVMQYVEGKKPTLDAKTGLEVGITLGRFHVVANSLPALHLSPSIAWALGSEYWGSAKRGLSAPLQELKYSTSLTRYALSTLTQNHAHLPQGLCHHDMHPGNVIMTQDDHACVLDFELCQKDYFINDVAHAALMFCAHQDRFDENAFFNLLAGYELSRPLCEAELHYLYHTALTDRAQLELISQQNLHNSGKPYGTEFHEPQYHQVLEWKKQNTFEAFTNQYETYKNLTHIELNQQPTKPLIFSSTDSPPSKVKEPREEDIHDKMLQLRL